MRRVLALVVLLAACSSDAPEPYPKKCDDGRNAVYVFTGSGPVLSGYFRDGDGDWEPTEDAPPSWQRVCTRDDFIVSITCVDDLDPQFVRHLTEQTAATVRDQHIYLMPAPCETPSPSTKPLYKVTMDAPSTGSPYLVNKDWWSVPQYSPSPTPEIDVPAGTYDLVTSDARDFQRIAEPHLTRQREIQIDGDTMLGTVDFSQGELPVDAPYEVRGGDPGEKVFASSEWAPFDYVGIEVATVEGTVAHVVPADLLDPADTQWVTMSGDGRSVEVQFPDTTSVMLPDRPTGVTFTRTGATWSTLPEMTSVVVERYTGDEVAITASATWLALHPQTSLDLWTDVPGYDPAWSVTKNAGLREFTVIDVTPDATYRSDVTLDEQTSARPCPGTCAGCPACKPATSHVPVRHRR